MTASPGSLPMPSRRDIPQKSESCGVHHAGPPFFLTDQSNTGSTWLLNAPRECSYSGITERTMSQNRGL